MIRVLFSMHVHSGLFITSVIARADVKLVFFRIPLKTKFNGIKMKSTKNADVDK